MKTMTIFGKKVVKYCQAMGFTLPWVAEKMDIATRQLNMYLRGTSLMPHELFKNLCVAITVSPIYAEYLLGLYSKTTNSITIDLVSLSDEKRYLIAKMALEIDKMSDNKCREILGKING